MDPAFLDRALWDRLSDALASRQGPWREGLFCCYSAPERSLLHRLTLRGASPATRTLKLRGARVRLKPGDAALWTFSDPAAGLDATFEGVIEPDLGADTATSTRTGTWRLRVTTLAVRYRVGAGEPAERRTRRFDYPSVTVPFRAPTLSRSGLRRAA